MFLEAKNIYVSYGSLTIVKDVSFTLNDGEWLMICGPNGAGKSTLVGAVTQGIPYSGEAFYDGTNIKRFKPFELAERFGVLTQSNSVNYSFSVEELVRLGRYSHSGGFFKNRSDSDDEHYVASALQKSGLEHLRKQSLLTLSGGELQRAFLAQVFAQNPKVLILDEPTNHLDLVYQKRIFELIQEWLTEPGRAVLSVVHDLNLAKAFGTRVLLMDKGEVVSDGTPASALNSETLNRVYNMDVAEWMRSMLEQWVDNSQNV